MASKTHVSAAVGIAGIALVLQVVGFVLPGWLVINIGENSIGIGLWSIESCVKEDCISITMEQVFHEPGQRMASASLSWKEYQVEATLSLIGAFLSICLLTAQTIVICVSKVNTTNSINTLAVLGASTSIGSALIGFIVVGRMAYVILNLMDVLPVISAPYALIIFALGSFVSIWVGGIEFFLRGMSRRESQTPYTNFENIAI
ncbi:hypothetical protein CHS0354_041972 [Potamilus streckersoni]|uniref:Uncharacterized protein n=1 Tax=Potamilus streckersoni TaxID=2493646 RepID=A0AAE0T9L7_9BIVA|nr:hypothetical protein CHS0354_041972 [Potamilus streckersoni]